jgi:hypothetical protein
MLARGGMTWRYGEGATRGPSALLRGGGDVQGNSRRGGCGAPRGTPRDAEKGDTETRG